jgi:hypothetical protein
MISILEPKHSLGLCNYWEATHNNSELEGNLVKVYRVRSTRDQETGGYIERRDESPTVIVSFDDGIVRYFGNRHDQYYRSTENEFEREEYTFNYFRTLLRSLNYLSDEDKLIIGQLIGTYISSCSSYVVRVDDDNISENLTDWYKVLADTDDKHGVKPNLSCHMTHMNYLMVLSMWLLFQQNEEFKHLTDHWINDIVSYASGFENANRTRVGVADDADEILTRELPNILKSFTNQKIYNLYSVNGIKHVPDSGIIHLHVGMASTDLTNEEDDENEVK